MNAAAKEVLYNEERSVKQALARGFRSKCPACGKGKLFGKQLYVVDNCGECGEELHHHRADDLPAYLNIFVVGHVVIGIMMVLMGYLSLSLWPLTFLTVFIALVAAFSLMRPLKGLVVGAQWAFRMHGFGGTDD